MNIQSGERVALEQAAAEFLTESIEKVLEQKSLATFAIAGGTSVAGIFELLRSTKVEWDKVHFFMLDERWVPEDHEDSNVRLLREHLTDHIDIPSENIHVFDIEKGVESYQHEFEACGGHVDVALVGAGPDGHIASLFPGHPGLFIDTNGYFEISDSPKPPPRRITLSQKTISEIDYATLLFFGDGKKEALQNFTNPNVSVEQCPAKIVQNISSHKVFTDIELQK